jgi:hypothetical protein
MLTTLIVAAALGVVPQQQTPPLFPRLFPAPTGQNALEYYVRASDLADQFGQRMVDALDLQQSNKSMLQWEEQLSSKGPEIVVLVKRGNQLPFTYPDSELAVKAMAGIKNLAKVLFGYARVQFAHGQPNQAVDALLTAMEMADVLDDDGPAISLMVGNVVDSIALAAFHDNYTQTPLRAAEDILQRIRLRSPEAFVARWREEVVAIDKDLRDPTHAWASSAGIREGMANLGSERMSTIQSRWSAAVGGATAGLEEVFAMPESRWILEKNRLDPTKLAPDETVAGFFSSIGPERMIEVAVLNRTRRRLLRLHALIAKKRWETGRLPESLEALPTDAIFDPAAGVGFVYKRFNTATYDLYSPGNRWHGEIRLKMTGEMPQIDDGQGGRGNLPDCPGPSGHVRLQTCDRATRRPRVTAHHIIPRPTPERSY